MRKKIGLSEASENKFVQRVLFGGWFGDILANRPMTEHEAKRFESFDKTPRGMKFIHKWGMLYIGTVGYPAVVCEDIFSPIFAYAIIPVILFIIGIIRKINSDSYGFLIASIVLALFNRLIVLLVGLSVGVDGDPYYDEAEKIYNMTDEEFDEYSAKKKADQELVQKFREVREKIPAENVRMFEDGYMRYNFRLSPGKLSDEDLGYFRSLTSEDTKKEYRELMKKYHPDNVKDDSIDTAAIISTIKKEYKIYMYFLENMGF